MKYICIKTVAIYLLAILPLLANASTHKVKITHSVMVGDGIAKFTRKASTLKRYLLLPIEKEPREQGALPADWVLVPEFSLTDGKANASLTVPEGTSIYGGGEVTGSLLRNGKTIKLWNTDSGAYGVDQRYSSVSITSLDDGSAKGRNSFWNFIRYYLESRTKQYRRKNRIKK